MSLTFLTLNDISAKWSGWHWRRW